MKFCNQCGKYLVGDVAFCNGCGVAADSQV